MIAAAAVRISRVLILKRKMLPGEERLDFGKGL